MMTDREQIAALKAERDWLRGLLIARTDFMPEEWRLSPKQRTIMGALLTHREPVSYSHLTELLWPNDDEPDNARGSMKVIAHHLKHRLARFGIKLCTAWGTGYYLDPPGKTIVLRTIQ